MSALENVMQYVSMRKRGPCARTDYEDFHFRERFTTIADAGQ